jgi:hypothetical protein
MFPFCDIPNICNLLTLEFDFLTSRVFVEDLAQSSWDPKFSEGCSEDIEWERGRCGCSLRHYRGFDLIVELPVNFSSPIVNETELGHIWDLLILDSLPCADSLAGCGLFCPASTQGYPNFSGLYCNMTQILVLLSYAWVLLWELCFVLASFSQDIGAI